MPPTPLEQLAAKLAYNHYHTSIASLDDANRGDDERGAAESHPLRSRVFDKDHSHSRPERTILIVGAGASQATFGEDEFPGTRKAVDEIDRLLGLKEPAMRDLAGLVATRKEEIERAYSYSKASTDFETHLAIVAGIFSQEKISSILAEMYGRRYRPHLVFELIAHMLKHRFIDVVINFNFDELLDQAIAGEMGSGEYHHIVSDGDCGDLKYLVGKRLKIPLYIKPHGTVRQPTSMRFTKDHYHQLPPPMRKLLSDVVAGHSSEQESARTQPSYKTYPVNLITLGFAMTSLDLLSIIHAAASAKKRPTRFHIFPIDLEEKRAEFNERTEWLTRPRFIPVKDRIGLTGTLRELWEKTKKHFREDFKPRGVARHEIIHRLFHATESTEKPGRRVPEKEGPYLQARLYTEVALALAKGNGQIDLSAQSEARVGRYFDLMWNHKIEVPMASILGKFTDGQTVFLQQPAGTIFRMPLTLRSPSRQPVVGERHTLLDPGAPARRANRQLAVSLWRHLRRALEEIKDNKFRAHLRQFGWTDHLRMGRQLLHLARSDAKDIDPRFQPSRLILSRKPAPDRVIHTSLGLTIRFVEMLREPWDLMLVVSELGKVVDKYLRHVKNKNIDGDDAHKRFCFVVADDERAEIATERLEMLGDRLLRFRDEPAFRLPSHVQTHHMVLLLRNGPHGPRPVSGISYRKSGIHNRINPIYLDRTTEDDLTDALTCFQTYVHESAKRITGDPNLSLVAAWEELMSPVAAKDEQAPPPGKVPVPRLADGGRAAPR